MAAVLITTLSARVGVGMGSSEVSFCGCGVPVRAVRGGGEVGHCSSTRKPQARALSWIRLKSAAL